MRLSLLQDSIMASCVAEQAEPDRLMLSPVEDSPEQSGVPELMLRGLSPSC